MGLQARADIFAQDFRSTSATKQQRVGTKAETLDGKVYRYSLAGGTTLDPGKLCVNADYDADGVNKTVAATYAAGVTSIVIDAGGEVTANSAADGYLTIVDATGEGVSLLVDSHTGTSGAAELTVHLAEPLPVALTVDVSEASLTPSPWSGVVISATDQADIAVGIPNVSITNAEYGWLQTHGVVAAWADEAFARGSALTVGTGAAGQVEAVDAAGEQVIGTAIEAGVDTEYRHIFLQID